VRLNAAPIWQATPPAERAAILERAADLMEAEIQPLMGLLVREAGKTFANAIAEVREAVDFLRYYAVQARNDFATTPTARWARWCASARGTSRWRSSAARSPPPWPPATRCWPSRPSRPR
jgi:RHH-type proline utilization regulon transcriptional repressor/proline dehydrogenase/delta 1-pyrroline-5-carboxylate dehydrogenase